jgi:uncharacterized membrane protein YfcA
METLFIIGAIFLSVFTHSLTGFGGTLVAMALLPGLLDIRAATPLAAMVAFSTEILLLQRYRRATNWRAILPVVIAGFIGIPLGVWALKGVDEKIIFTILGLVIAGYALYALFEFKLPELRHALWGYVAGLVAGILGGAYATTGPPVVIYASCRRWPPAEFKGNLQVFFLLTDLLVVLNHAVAGNLTPLVWSHYLWALLALFLGIISGVWLDRYIPPAIFRKLILIFLVVMGVRMIWMYGLLAG